MTLFQLLLLLNREEDPTAIVTPHFDDDFFKSIFDDSSQASPNATHKMVLDIFQVTFSFEAVGRKGDSIQQQLQPPIVTSKRLRSCHVSIKINL